MATRDHTVSGVEITPVPRTLSTLVGTNDLHVAEVLAFADGRAEADLNAEGRYVEDVYRSRPPRPERAAHGIRGALVGIDDEMGALGVRPDGTPWTIAVDVQGRRLSHAMDPNRGAPLSSPPASVTVISSTCAEADA